MESSTVFYPGEARCDRDPESPERNVRPRGGHCPAGGQEGGGGSEEAGEAGGGEEAQGGGAQRRDGGGDLREAQLLRRPGGHVQHVSYKEQSIKELYFNSLLKFLSEIFK